MPVGNPASTTTHKHMEHLKEQIDATAIAILERKQTGKKNNSGLSLEAKALCEAEAQNRITLRSVTSEEWLERINTLPEGEVRNRAASVVWWDFFGNRDATDPWTHLNHLVAIRAEKFDMPENMRFLSKQEQKEWNAKYDAWEREQNSRLTTALHQIGYTAYAAFMRTKGDE